MKLSWTYYGVVMEILAMKLSWTYLLSSCHGHTYYEVVMDIKVVLSVDALSVVKDRWDAHAVVEHVVVDLVAFNNQQNN